MSKKKKTKVKKPSKKSKVKSISKSPKELFSDWWNKIAVKKVDKIEEDWLKKNEPNDPEEDGGGDDWCVNEMMHNGDAHEMTYDIAEQVFMKGCSGEAWEYSQSDSLYCELDDVICEAYNAGKNSRV